MKKSKPRAHKPREITLLFTAVSPDGHMEIKLVRGPLPATAPQAPASGLLWAQLNPQGHLAFQEVLWADLDSLQPMIRDALYAACGDGAAKERLAAPQLSGGAGVPTLVHPNGQALLRRGGSA